MISVGFSTTNKLLSRIIKWFTRSNVSHTFLIFDVYDIKMVLEASTRGVGLIPYETFQKENIIVATIDLPYSIDSIKFLLLDLGSAYDVSGLFGSFFVQIGKLFKQRWRNPWDNSKAMFCSEFITMWLKMQEYPGTETLEPSEVSPSDLLTILKPNN